MAGQNPSRLSVNRRTTVSVKLLDVVGQLVECHVAAFWLVIERRYVNKEAYSGHSVEVQADYR
jgi:hypothetical protein